MSDSVWFGGDTRMSALAATLETIFNHVRKYAVDNPELMGLVAREEEFDAMGGWPFDTLSLSALERLQNVLERLDADLPDSISNWKVEWRPVFYKDFEEFKQKLGERTAQLRTGATVKEAD
jgi:hypothetical protein